MNSYDAVGSVIPCEKLHKHQCFHSIAMAACFDRVGSFPTRWCDDSEESDWPAAIMCSKQFWNINEESMGMARSKSHGTDSFWCQTVTQSRSPPVGSEKKLFSAAFMKPWTVYILHSWFGGPSQQQIKSIKKDIYMISSFWNNKFKVITTESIMSIGLPQGWQKKISWLFPDCKHKF